MSNKEIPFSSHKVVYTVLFGKFQPHTCWKWLSDPTESPLAAEDVTTLRLVSVVYTVHTNYGFYN